MRTLLPISLLLVSLFALTYHHLELDPLTADEQSLIKGYVVNGSTGETTDGLGITLHVFNSDGSTRTDRTVSNPSGNFSFDGISKSGTEKYIISTTYQDVIYTVKPSESHNPTMLYVFDTTNDLTFLKVDSHMWIIRSVSKKNRSIAAAEIILISNEDSMTFKPNLGTTNNMNLLRFSVPPQAYGLEVQSDLQEGEIIDVGTGFGLTSAIPPGLHQITFSYNFPYDEETISFSRSLPMGAEIFRILIPDSVAAVEGNDLAEVDSTIIDGTSYRVWNALNLLPTHTLPVQLFELPQPSLWDKAISRFFNGNTLLTVILSILGICLVTILTYSILSYKASQSIDSSNNGFYESQMDVLITKLAELDFKFENMRVSETEYKAERTKLKQNLLEIQKKLLHG